LLSKAKYARVRTMLADVLLELDPHDSDRMTREAIGHIEKGALALVRGQHGPGPDALAQDIRAASTPPQEKAASAGADQPKAKKGILRRGGKQ
jgi:hypothetical protein